MRRDRKLLAKVLAAALFTFSMILPSFAEDIEWVDVGSMFVQMHADNRCPKACGERKWSGNWKTVTSPVTSLCECIGKKPPPKPERTPRPGAHFVEGGFITWDGAARQLCPLACGNTRWTGVWFEYNHPAAKCECEDRPVVQPTAPPVSTAASPWPKLGKTKPGHYQAQAGNINSEAAAQKACPKACKGDRWSGKWHRGSLPSLQATCDCVSK